MENVELSFDKIALFNEINVILDKDPSAKSFVLEYTQYVHMIDDLIDEGIKSHENLISVFYKASQVFSNDFYRRYCHMLFTVNALITNTYSDIVRWEKSEVNWKVSYADSARHCALDMFYAVILILGGMETLRNISIRFREHCIVNHLSDLIDWLEKKE